MANYYWIIEKDFILANGYTSTGIEGPSNAPVPTKFNNGAEFRMLDDDENIYYTGKIFGDYDGFEPLDDFGMPYAGCVDIQYKEDGKWTSL